MTKQDTFIPLLVLAAVAGCDLPSQIDVQQTDLYPEGIAWSDSLGSFLVGSLSRGTVGTVDRHGEYTELVADPDLVNVAGLAIDDDRGRVLACSSFLGFPQFAPAPGSINEGAAPGSVMALGIYDLQDGHRLHYVDLSSLSQTQLGHVCNDVDLDAAGNAYVTDSATPAIYRVTPDGEASVVVEDPSLEIGPNEFHLNGIVVHPDGYLLVSRYQTGQLFRVDLGAPALVEVQLGGVDIVHADGLVLDDDERLVVVTNAQFGVGSDRVVWLESDDAWASATATAEFTDEAFEGPTTAALAEGHVFVLNAHIERFLTGQPQDDYEIVWVTRP